MSVEENQGIKLRSGRVILPRKHYYDYSDSDSDDNSYGYLCDSSDEYYVPPSKTLFDWDYVSESCDKFVSSLDSEYDLPIEYVEESIEKKIASKIEVPSGFGDEAGIFLAKFNGCYQDCFISHDQLHELVKDFAKHLSWFPNNVPCRNVNL